MMKPELREARRVALRRIIRDLAIVTLVLFVVGYLGAVGVTP